MNPIVAGPAPVDYTGRSIPLEDLDPNPAEGKDSLELGAGSTNGKGKRALPLDDLRQAIKGIENIQNGSPPKIHDFVATDDGIIGSAMAGLPEISQLSRSDALKIMDKSEVTQGLFCPCITYGKIKHELDQAQKNRAGEEVDEEDKFNACNGPCCSYAAVTVFLLCEFTSRQTMLQKVVTELTRV